MDITRPVDASLATHSKKTNPAPTNASVIIKINEKLTPILT